MKNSNLKNDSTLGSTHSDDLQNQLQIAADRFFSLFFKSIGEDEKREGLAKTKDRFLYESQFLFSGYNKDPLQALDSVFSDIVSDDMVIVKNIGFYSMCEHHLLPFFGDISIGYIPDKRVVGLSNLAKCVEVLARRLQIQENLTAQIANSIMQSLKPKGVMVVCEATHLCMSMRGVEKENAKVSTSAIRGLFKRDPKTRLEFMQLIK